MRKTLEKSARFGEVLEIMYLAKDGTISKRRIKVLHMHKETCAAYCYLRKSKRTFIINNVLAAVPIIYKERVIV